MAGEPPDVQITPRLSHIALMDFDRSAESIAEGREATRRRAAEIEKLVDLVQ
jgi:NTE family protein